MGYFYENDGLPVEIPPRPNETLTEWQRRLRPPLEEKSDADKR